MFDCFNPYVFLDGIHPRSEISTHLSVPAPKNSPNSDDIAKKKKENKTFKGIGKWRPHCRKKSHVNLTARATDIVEFLRK